MKKTLLIVMAAMVTILAAAGLPFKPGMFEDKTIIVCFTKDAVGNTQGNFDFSVDGGVVKTGWSSFDQLAVAYGVENMKQEIRFVKDQKWSCPDPVTGLDIYPMNIYRLTLKSNDKIDEAVEAIAKDSNIAFAELSGIVHQYYTPNDLQFSGQWALPKIMCPEAWDYGFTSSDVIIAVTDSGVNWTHPDLSSNIWINEAELPGVSINWSTGTITGGDGIDNDGNGYVDDVMGWDFYNGDNNPNQPWAANDHGTHVSGCASAVGDNWEGVVGSGANAKIMCLKGAPDNVDSDGIAYGSNMIYYAADNNADVINCSWGGPGNGSQNTAAVNYATEHGSLVVAAAGNDDRQHGPGIYTDYPADIEAAFCVASTENHDYKSDFSDYGTPIDICAPGSNILATTVGGGYDRKSGTSMASPIVAGVAAMVKAAHPEFTPAQLKQRIMDTADPIDGLNEDYVGLLGAGRVNAFRALHSDVLPSLSIFSAIPMEAGGDIDGNLNPGDQISIILSLFNEFGWEDAEGVQAQISCDVPGVSIVNGTTSFPTIVSGAYGDAQDVLNISTSPDLSTYTLPIKVTVTANAAIEYQKELSFDINLTLEQAGFPYSLGGEAISAPIFVDLLGNDSNVLVFGDYSGKVHAVLPDGENELPGFPVQVGSSLSGSVAIWDLDTDSPGKEIVATTENNLIVALKADGSTMWTVTGSAAFKTNAVIVDVDSRPGKEIVAADTGGNIYVLNPDGSNFANFPVSTGLPVYGSPAVADITGDGHPEIVIAAINGNFTAISTTDAQVVSGFPVAAGGTVWKGITLADLNNDGDLEIIIALGTPNGTIKAYNPDGTELYAYNSGSSVKSGVVAYDLDGDGNLEVICGNYDGDLVVLDNQLSPKQGFPVDTGGTIDSTPIIADLDYDGSPELIYGDATGYVNAINISGAQIRNFPVQLGSAMKTSAAIGYFDADGDPDIAVSTTSAMAVIDYKHEGSINSDYRTYRGSSHRAGYYSFYTPTLPDTQVNPMQTKLFANRPNPFNPTTTLSFNLAKAGNATLNIYNLKGQLVRNLVSGHQTAGNHTVVFTGVDNNGTKLPSGLYLYRLNTAGKSITKKMLMLK